MWLNVKVNMYNMGNEFETRTCSQCGYNRRHNNLQIECNNCGAKRTVFGLYLKRHERIGVYIGITLVVLAIALVVYKIINKLCEINQLKQIIDNNVFLIEYYINLIG